MEAIDSAARARHASHTARGGQSSSHASRARAARPRWLIASFSESESSAMVRPPSPSSGRKRGRSRTRRRPGARGPSPVQRPRPRARGLAVHVGPAQIRPGPRQPGTRPAACPDWRRRPRPGPAKRAERTPGAPPSASARCPSRRRSRARRSPGRPPGLEERVLGEGLPRLGRQLEPSGSATISMAGQQSRNSRTLCGLRVASTSRATGAALRLAPLLGLAKTSRPLAASARRSSRWARESGYARRWPGPRRGRRAGHDDVGVDLRACPRGSPGRAAPRPRRARRDGGDRAGQRRSSRCPRRSSPARETSATWAPVIEAQRVPPSAWKTSQSM